MSRSAQEIILGFDATGNPVCLPLGLLHRHAYVCGQSGSGKSKLLEHTLRHLIRRWQHQRSIWYNGFLQNQFDEVTVWTNQLSL